MAGCWEADRAPQSPSERGQGRKGRISQRLVLPSPGAGLRWLLEQMPQQQRVPGKLAATHLKPGLAAPNTRGESTRGSLCDEHRGEEDDPARFRKAKQEAMLLGGWHKLSSFPPYCPQQDRDAMLAGDWPATSTGTRGGWATA